MFFSLSRKVTHHHTIIMYLFTSQWTKKHNVHKIKIAIRERDVLVKTLFLFCLLDQVWEQLYRNVLLICFRFGFHDRSFYSAMEILGIRDEAATLFKGIARVMGKHIYRLCLYVFIVITNYLHAYECWKIFSLMHSYIIRTNNYRKDWGFLVRRNVII